MSADTAWTGRAVGLEASGGGRVANLETSHTAAMWLVTLKNLILRMNSIFIVSLGEKCNWRYRVWFSPHNRCIFSYYVLFQDLAIGDSVKWDLVNWDSAIWDLRNARTPVNQWIMVCHWLHVDCWQILFAQIGMNRDKLCYYSRVCNEYIIFHSSQPSATLCSVAITWVKRHIVSGVQASKNDYSVQSN